MITEKQEQKISLKDFIAQKRTYFNEVKFINIPDKQKINFMECNGLTIYELKKEEQKNYDKGLLLLGCVFSFSIAISILINPFFIFFNMISIMLAFKIRDKAIPKPLINKITEEWFNNEKNEALLKSEMFNKSVVDEETLVYFSKTYGEKELVNLLMNKEHLTYNDMILYIDKEKEREAEKEKEIRLTKAIRCMNLKETVHQYNN